MHLFDAFHHIHKGHPIKLFHGLDNFPKSVYNQILRRGYVLNIGKPAFFVARQAQKITFNHNNYKQG